MVAGIDSSIGGSMVGLIIVSGIVSVAGMSASVAEVAAVDAGDDSTISEVIVSESGGVGVAASTG